MHFSPVKYLRDKKIIKLIGKKVKQLREEQNLSQRQLAFETGTSETQIRRIEKGQINTGISTLVAIAKALNIPPKELLNFPLPGE